MSSPIVLLTDFGVQDPYVGIMKGVISQIAPGALVIDLTHQIPPGQIQRAALILWQAYSYFPGGTIFVCVVDPGVGTRRRPLILNTAAGKSSSYTWIGPDNGLFSYILPEKWQAWEIENRDYLLPRRSSTFHGRDIFAPAAAHAWRGVFGDELGPEVGELVRLPSPHLELTQPGRLVGEVLYADQFGNLLTSLGRFERQGEDRLQFIPWLPGADGYTFLLDGLSLHLPDGQVLPLVGTFQAAGQGCAALVGSSGLLEIIANERSAAHLLQLEPGTRLVLQEAQT
jgi:S-adenosyl-L-methionine hydrolase (adenosine-forming)